MKNLRNSQQKHLGVLSGNFEGFWCPNNAHIPCCLRLCVTVYVISVSGRSSAYGDGVPESGITGARSETSSVGMPSSSMQHEGDVSEAETDMDTSYRLHTLRLMLLERLFQYIPELHSVGGVRAIPFLQVNIPTFHPFIIAVSGQYFLIVTIFVIVPVNPFKIIFPMYCYICRIFVQILLIHEFNFRSLWSSLSFDLFITEI